MSRNLLGVIGLTVLAPHEPATVRCALVRAATDASRGTCPELKPPGGPICNVDLSPFSHRHADRGTARKSRDRGRVAQGLR